MRRQCNEKLVGLFVCLFVGWLDGLLVGRFVVIGWLVDFNVELLTSAPGHNAGVAVMRGQESRRHACG